MTDELWMDGAADVLPEGAEEKSVVPKSGTKGKKEKANVGKKRKAPEAEVVDDVSAANGDEQPSTRKSKRSKKKARVPESNDDKLDDLIAERKANLKRQKDAARKEVGG
jgi:hypothetical protein